MNRGPFCSVGCGKSWRLEQESEHRRNVVSVEHALAVAQVVATDHNAIGDAPYAFADDCRKIVLAFAHAPDLSF